MAIGVAAWIAIGALAVSAGAAYMQHKAAVRALRFRKKSAATQKAEQESQAAQKRKMQVRQERIRRAQILSSASASGAFMSSGSMGSQSAVGSLVEGNIAAINRNLYSANAESGFLQSAANAQGDSNTYGQISSLAGSVSNIFMQTPSAQAGMSKLFS